MQQHSSLTLYVTEFSDRINVDFELSVLDHTCSFAEGPVWNSEGHYLFSDIPKNEICAIAPGIQKEVYLKESGCTLEDRSFLSEQTGSNGLAFDGKGRLHICQHGNGALAMLDGGRIEPLVPTYEGRRFNSPNDLVIHPDGSIFFTDPPYGLKGSELAPGRAQGHAGLYCFRGGNIHLVSEAFRYPNGVCLSPDSSILYCCSNKPIEKTVLMFDAQSLQPLGILCAENSDGIKCDRSGHLWLCTKEGIVVVNDQGVRVAKIELPTVPANCCWGGADGQDLLITARENIFYIKGLLRG